VKGPLACSGAQHLPVGISYAARRLPPYGQNHWKLGLRFLNKGYTGMLFPTQIEVAFFVRSY